MKQRESVLKNKEVPDTPHKSKAVEKNTPKSTSKSSVGERMVKLQDLVPKIVKTKVDEKPSRDFFGRIVKAKPQDENQAPEGGNSY